MEAVLWKWLVSTGLDSCLLVCRLVGLLSYFDFCASVSWYMCRG